MNDDTIIILKKYDVNAKIIDVSNKNIEGLLDLRGFKELEKVYCSDNIAFKQFNWIFYNIGLL